MTPLALIHGWGLGSAVWQPLVSALEIHAPHCRVHLLDLPGYGTAAPDSGSFGQVAQKMLANLPPDGVLCGWSLGALLALQMALLAPSRIARLVLVGASPCFMQRDDWPEAQPPALLDSFIHAIAEQPEATLQRFAALLNQGDAEAKRNVRQLRQQLAATPLPAPESLEQGLLWLRDVDLRPMIASIRVPIHLIHGANDPLMPATAARWLHQTLPEARLEVFANTAHAPFLSHPERFAKILAELKTEN